MVKKSNRFLLFSIAKLGKLDLYAFWVVSELLMVLLL